MVTPGAGVGLPPGVLLGTLGVGLLLVPSVGVGVLPSAWEEMVLPGTGWSLASAFHTPLASSLGTTRSGSQGACS